MVTWSMDPSSSVSSAQITTGTITSSTISSGTLTLGSPVVYGIHDEPTLLRENSRQLLLDALIDALRAARLQEPTDSTAYISDTVLRAILNFGLDQYETGKEDGYEQAEQDYVDGKW